MAYRYGKNLRDDQSFKPSSCQVHVKLQTTSWKSLKSDPVATLSSRFGCKPNILRKSRSVAVYLHIMIEDIEDVAFFP